MRVFLAICFFLVSGTSLFCRDTLQILPGNFKQLHGYFLKENWMFTHEKADSLHRPLVFDKDWVKGNPEHPGPPGFFKGDVIWAHLWIKLHPDVLKEPFGIVVHHKGASEIYLDGKLIGTYGIVSDSASTEKRFTPYKVPYYFPIHDTFPHLIAVRYSNHDFAHHFDEQGLPLGGFKIEGVMGNQKNLNAYLMAGILPAIFSILGAILLTLGMLHFLIYLFYRIKRAHLFYSLFVGSLGILFAGGAFSFLNPDTDVQNYTTLFILFVIPFIFISLLAFSYAVVYPKFPRAFWFFFGFGLLTDIVLLLNEDLAIGGILLIMLAAGFESIRAIIVGIRRKVSGSWILGGAIISIALLFILVALTPIILQGDIRVFTLGWMEVFLLTLVFLIFMGIPASMSVYLARDISQTNKSLTAKLAEVEALSQKNLEQEKEKQRILANQNLLLETQVKERTKELEHQKRLVEEKNKDITDSINYARKIQESLLPSPEKIKQLFPDAFVLFKPRDIVSGDFYFVEETPEAKFFALADCTGHGVPGAFMSMIGTSFLHEIISEKKVDDPGLIMDELRNKIISTLKQTGKAGENRDGMDMCLFRFPKAGGEILFAGGNGRFYVTGNNETMEYRCDKQPVGYSEFAKPFSTGKLSPSSGSVIFVFSDGIADQFGGREGKKFKYRRLQELLQKIHALPPQEQKNSIDREIETWKAGYDQVDDICLAGIRIL
jgi:two-component system, sensor histidine kinase LadS